MQKILIKRVFRDLKDNFFQYFALSLLIILGMYMVISMVAASDTIINGTDKKAKENYVEDGEFGVFVPLIKSEEDRLKNEDITLEQMFYLDFQIKDNSTLRIFKNRKNINLIDLDKGRLAKKEYEIVLEKRYCSEHNLDIGDKIDIVNKDFLIVGIGSTPDYDATYKNLSDSSVESNQFGLGFVNDNCYENVKASGKSVKSEEYIYSYLLNNSMTNNQLKDKLEEIKFSKDDVDDHYFQEYWEATAGKKEELKDGIDDLVDGSDDLNLALEKLSDNNGDLQNGAKQIFKLQIKGVNDNLSKLGIEEIVTEDNFSSILGNLKDNSSDPILKLEISHIIKELNELKNFKNGIGKYTNGVEKAKDGSENLKDGTKELKKQSDELIDKYFDVDTSNISFFLKASENPRIGAAADDQAIDKMCGLVSGVIIILLITYVISVFVIQNIESEMSIIGTLYALGAKKKDLIIHYIMIPIFVTFIAGIIGTIIGFSRWGITNQMKDCYGYFSLPNLNTIYPLYLIVYGVIMPPVLAIIVNCIVINKRLSRPALSLIKNEQKNGKTKNINLGNMGFVSRFRIRQMLRESRTGFTVIFGMFISMLVMMLGLDCYVMCRNVSIENKADTKYEYMYTFKYPEKEVPKDGEACFSKTLKKEIYGYNLDVTMLGIDNENPYFDANTNKSKNKVVISSAMAQKYNLQKGEQLVLSDEEKDMDYAFKITDITQYSTGLYVFMDIDSMRELFDEDDDYYNLVLSDKKLDIESGRLYSTTSKKDISRASDIFISKMMPMVYVLCIVSALIFCVVMYLMMKVMIDRSEFSISLAKIFGYGQREIRKLYLNGNFYIIAVGAVISIALSKLLIDYLFPLLVSNISCSTNLEFSWQFYLGIYMSVIVIYFIVNQMLIRKLKNIIPAEVIKNRE